jgi:hypothetical protein
MNFVPGKRFYIITLLLISFLSIQAQNNTSSPYSLFGLGELENKAIGATAGMGGTGVGMKSTNSLNTTNPASYSGIDSISFIYELCTSAKLSIFRENSLKQVDRTGNVKKLDLGFRVKPWWALGVGIAPFSSVGYNISTSGTIQGSTNTVTTNIQGTGGITQVFFLNSISITKNLAIGANVSYLFGSIDQVQTKTSAVFSETPSIQVKNSFHNVYGTYGIQYSNHYDPVIYTIGVVYSPHNYVKSKKMTYITVGTDTTRHELSQTAFALPDCYGIGFSLNKSNQFLLAFDYKLQRWADVVSSDINTNVKSTDISTGYSNYTYVNSHQYSFGLQYTPQKRFSTSYFDKMMYQVGLNYMNSYLKINGEPIYQYAVTCGVGLPIKNNNSYFNVAFEYGRNGSTNNGLIQEDYFMIHLNVIMHDFWFLKSKYN